MSWSQLLSIAKEAAAEADAAGARPPVACPNDGEPLLTGPDGGLYCPFDFWRPDGR
jgi:hypothetical protein